MGNNKYKKRKKSGKEKPVREKTRQEKVREFLNEYIWIITIVISAIIVGLIVFSATTCGDACNSRYDSCTAACDSVTDGCTPAKDSTMPAAADGEQLAMPAEGEEIVVIQTSMGTIKLRLFPDAAPATCQNFKNLIYEGYYNGITFHRVMNDFMIQGGDPEGTGFGGEAHGGGTIIDEFSRNLFNIRGALAMANTGEANSGGSQFFIVQANTCQYTAGTLSSAGYPEWAVEAYTQYGGTPHLDGEYNAQIYPGYLGHTVFGQVFEGMDVVDAIAAVATDQNAKPLQDVMIERIYLTTYASASGNAAQ
ncbi:MAG: peptidylprolyl isomerase [Ruminococcaceae bacterium]|nr:peptidylprolyl isomerase [Oscillospiraceae bacterium]